MHRALQSVCLRKKPLVSQPGRREQGISILLCRVKKVVCNNYELTDKNLLYYFL